MRRFPWLPCILASVLTLVACHKTPTRLAHPPTPSAAVGEFQEAERHFRSGNYTEAAASYETYLRDQPTAPNQDLVMVRLAMMYATPVSPVRNLERSRMMLDKVVTLFPDSPWAPVADFIRGAQQESLKLASDVVERDERIRSYRDELESLKKSESELLRKMDGNLRSELETIKAEVRDREDRIRRLTLQLEERQDRIHRLTSELDALKKIDIQRRPSRPPRR